MVLALALLNAKTCSAADGLQSKLDVSLAAKSGLHHVMTNVCLLLCARCRVFVSALAGHYSVATCTQQHLGEQGHFRPWQSSEVAVTRDMPDCGVSACARQKLAATCTDCVIVHEAAG
jgi:hypothetical protein